MSDGVKLHNSEGQRKMDEWREAVEDIEQRGHGLTPWENSFVESVSDQLTQGRPLTDRQAEILARIADERV